MSRITISVQYHMVQGQRKSINTKLSIHELVQGCHYNFTKTIQYKKKISICTNVKLRLHLNYT